MRSHALCVMCYFHQVSIKHVAQVHLEQLERVLRGEDHVMPFDAIQSLDVVMRHLPSMKYVGRVRCVHV